MCIPEIITAEVKKPEQVVQKIVEGQISKWKKELCLLDQPWVKDDKKTIRDLQTELVAKLRDLLALRQSLVDELAMMLTDDELDEMAALGRSRRIEISLFVGCLLDRSSVIDILEFASAQLIVRADVLLFDDFN